MDWALSTPSKVKSSPDQLGKLPGELVSGGVNTITSDMYVASNLFRKGVNLVPLDIGTIGSSFCGGMIGKPSAQKMCVKQNCNIASHLRKCEIQNVGTEQRLFICTKTEDSESVFVQPSLATSVLGRDISRYLTESRPVEAWITFFTAMSSEEGNEKILPTEQDVARVIRKIDEEVMEGKTPLKKRKGMAVLSPRDSEFSELNFTEIFGELDGSDEMILSMLKIQWPLLVQNFANVNKIVNETREGVRTLGEVSTSELEQIDLQLAQFKGLIGKRDEERGTSTIFYSLKNNESEIENLLVDMKQVNKVMSMMKTQIGGSKQDILTEMLSSMHPIIEFFSKFSSAKNCPGDKIEDELNSLKVDVALLKTQTTGAPVSSGIGVQAYSNSGSGVTWGVTGGSTPTSTGLSAPMATNPSSRITVGIEARLSTLETKLSSLEEQLIASRVDLGGQVFKSKHSTAAWLLVHAPSSEGFIYFADPHSLLNVGSVDFTSTTEAITLEAHSHKSGYKSKEEAHVMASFTIELPEIFGKDPKASNASKDTRVLPAVKTYGDWDRGDGYNGARYRYFHKISEGQNTLINASRNHLQGMALMVSHTAIGESALFLQALGNWITQEFQDLVGRGSEEVQAWQLISHCVRAIFSELHQARLPGRGPYHPTEKASSVVWGCLQGILKMREFMNKGFTSHPFLSHILNMHLRDNVVSRLLHNDLVKKVKDLEKTVESVKKVAERALSKK